MFLIDDIVGLPVKLAMMVVEKIRGDADSQMLKTEESVRAKYMEVQMAYESGELEEKDYIEWTAFLESRLKEIKEYEGGEESENGRSA